LEQFWLKVQQNHKLKFITMKRIFVLAAAIGTTVMVGCKKEATTSPDAPSSNISYELATTDDDAAGGRMNGAVVWTGGYATVSDIKFDAKGDNNIEYKSRITRTIDLFDALSTLGGLTVPPGTYRKIKVKIGFKPTSTASAFELRGVYTPYTGLPIPIILKFDRPFELKYDMKQTIIIDATNSYTITNTLPINALLSQLTESLLSNAVRDNTGTVVISANSNTALYNPIWNVFQSIMKVHVKKKK
jgi:hypothetical protein